MAYLKHIVDDHFKNWEIPIIILVITLSATLSGTSVQDFLVYERTAILNGEAWRIISGHLVQTGLTHWLMNSCALIMLWALYGDLWSRLHWLILIALLSIMVSCGLLLFNPELDWYAGLSGILHGVLVVGALRKVTTGQYYYMVLLALTALKLGYEQLYGPSPGTQVLLQVPVISDAHLYGAISGIVAASLNRHFFR